MHNNYYKMGSYNCICDRCGRKFKRDQCQKEWTGLLTCFNCYDPRHPVTQVLPVVVDSKSIPDARPRPPAQYIQIASGLSVWDAFYEGIQGLDPDLTWDTWTSTWDGGLPDDDFILGV